MTSRRFFSCFAFCILMTAFVAGTGCNSSGGKPDLSQSTIIVTPAGVGTFTVTGTLLNSGTKEGENIVLTVNFYLNGVKVGADSRQMGSLGAGDSMEVAYVIEDGPTTFDRIDVAFQAEFEK
jgi:hypothetical protein